MSKIVLLLALFMSFGFFMLQPAAESSQDRKNIEKSFLCPVSFTINQNLTSDYFTYPLDVFDSENVMNGSVKNLMRCTIFDVNTRDGFTPNDRTNHSCSKHQFCPVAKENIASLSLASDDTPKHNASICFMQKTLSRQKSKEPVRLIAFGGSVTAGYFANGCKYDINECAHHLSECTQCTWMAHLGRWFTNHFSSANVSWYNLAVRGHGSAEYEPMAIAELKNVNITTLTSNDIIFFDFSTNDNYCNTDCSVEVESGLEGLIRHVYTYARDTANERKATVSFPTIVFLESEPDLKRTEWDQINVLSPYHRSYRKISKLYHIPIWSPRDVALSKYSIENQAYNKVLKYFEISDNHPGWDLHLFQADIYAAKLLASFHDCSKKWANTSDTNSLNTASIRQKYEIIRLIEAPVAINRYNNYTKPCNETAVRVLDFTYRNMVQKKPVVGAWKSYPEGSWQVREDVLGRGGFIRELNYSTVSATTIATTTANNNRTSASTRHHKKKKSAHHRNLNNSNIMNNYELESKIVFTLANITRQQILEQTLNLNLDLKYLRTYHNAGVVTIRYCGLEVSISGENYREIRATHELDALWPNYKTYRFSLPVMFSVPLKFDYCWFGTGHDETEVHFEILHKVIDRSKLHSPALVAARDKQKFKIVSIRACIV